MAGLILVADDHEPNRRLLQARLESEYFDVVLAQDGVEAIEAAAAELPDLILMDVMMPRMDGYEATRALKADPRTRHIPVVMVTALGQQDDRVRGLQAGADDFLTKPIDDVILFARVRSLLRLSQTADERRSRSRGARRAAGLRGEDDLPRTATDVSDGARILIAADLDRGERPAERLSADHHTRYEPDPRRVLRAAREPIDLVVVDLRAQSFDGMRLCAQLKSDEATRRLPVLAIVDARDRERLVRALDLGVSDVVTAPASHTLELDTRVRALVRRKRYADYLRQSIDQRPPADSIDALTGLIGRQAVPVRLAELVEEARAADKPLSIVVARVDQLPEIERASGREAAERALVEIVGRLAALARPEDVLARTGPAELTAILPDADVDLARDFAERLRRAVADQPACAPDPGHRMTASLGVTRLEPTDDVCKLLERVVQAVAAAEERGCNKVIVARVKRAA